MDCTSLAKSSHANHILSRPCNKWCNCWLSQLHVPVLITCTREPTVTISTSTTTTTMNDYIAVSSNKNSKTCSLPSREFQGHLLPFTNPFCLEIHTQWLQGWLQFCSGSYQCTRGLKWQTRAGEPSPSRHCCDSPKHDYDTQPDN